MNPTVRSAVLAVVLMILTACGGLGSEADTEEGFFSSGPTRLSYALDIPTVGVPPYPLVVFVHDSGPNKKSEFEGRASRLLKHGVATFRFDKRGVGKSEGVYERGFVDLELLAGDVLAAINVVTADPRIDSTRIGLMGSSQAGWIVPVVASQSERVSFTILRSAPAVTVAQHNFWAELAEDDDRTIAELSDELATFELPAGDFDPRPFIEEMSAPGLWLLGGEDRIIPAHESAQIVEAVANEQGSPLTAIVYPDAGHSLKVDYWVDLLPWLDSAIRVP